MKTTIANIENLRKQQESIYASSQTILCILTIDLNDIVKCVIFKEHSFTGLEFTGKNIIELFPAANQDLIKQIHQNVKKNLNQEFYETSFIDKQGEAHAINVQLVPNLENQNVISLTAIVKDITECKKEILAYNQYEEKLLFNEAEFRKVFNELLIGIVVHDSNTEIIYSNNEACRILGLSSEQMLGKVALDKEWMFVHENLEPVELADYPIHKVLHQKCRFQTTS